MEDGSRTVYQRIFAIRRLLPELNGPHADYLGVKAEPGVFACLRHTGDGASVLLVNLNPTAVPGTVSVPLDRLPPTLHSCSSGRDLWGDHPVSLQSEGDSLVARVPLPAYGFTVLALRSDAAKLPRVPRPPNAWGTAVSPAPVTRPASAQGPLLTGGDVSCRIDTGTGLPAEILVKGVPVTGTAELFLAAAQRSGETRCAFHPSPNGLRTESVFEAGRLIMTYSTTPNSFDWIAEWDGADKPVLAQLSHAISEFGYFSAVRSHK